MSRLTAEMQQKDSWCAVHLSGYLSSDSAPALEAAFDQAAADKILLVFEAKTLISSAGLAVSYVVGRVFPPGVLCSHRGRRKTKCCVWRC